MSWQAQAQEARDALARADFGPAASFYGELLEAHPDQLELQAGYYIASFWINRKDSIQLRRPGRERAEFMQQEWQLCQQELRKHEFDQTAAAFSARQAVLGQAAEQYREAYQSGASTADTVSILHSLALCLLEIDDLQNAAEVAAFASRQNPRDAQLLFVLGEALARQQDPVAHTEGLACLRDACLLDHARLDALLLQSHPAREVLDELLEEQPGDLIHARDWFGAYFMARLFKTRLRDFEQVEIQSILSDLNRLQNDLRKTPPRFQDRVRALLSFQILCLMHYLQFTEPDRARQREWEAELRRIAPELADYIQNIQNQDGSG